MESGTPEPHSHSRGPADFLAEYGGDSERAMGELVSACQEELRVLARRVRGKRDVPPSLATTDLMNEVYLRLIGGTVPVVHDHEHFLAIATRTMRWILINRGRRARPVGDVPSGLLEDTAEFDRSDLVDLEQALESLREVNADHAKVVELRYFLTLTWDEIALATGLSEPGARRAWKSARRWLYRRLDREGAES